MTQADGWTAFSFAAINGMLATVDYLASVPQVNVHNYDRFKRSALHWASRHNNYLMVQKLLDLGIDYAAKDIESQNCRNLATEYKCIDALKILLMHEQSKKKNDREQKQK